MTEYPSFRVVVTGSRNWVSHRQLADALARVLAKEQQFLLGVGDCPTGADAMTLTWGQKHLMWPVTVFQAPWTMNGRFAGPVRNHFMIDQFRPDLVLAFFHPDSRGTKDCAEYALSLGITVRSFYEGPIEGGGRAIPIQKDRA